MQQRRHFKLLLVLGKRSAGATDLCASLGRGLGRSLIAIYQSTATIEIF